MTPLRVTAIVLVAGACAAVAWIFLFSGTGGDRNDAAGRGGRKASAMQSDSLPIRNRDAQFNRTEKRLSKLARTSGPAAAFAALEASPYATSGPRRGGCHALLHSIGLASFAYFRNDGPRTIAADPTTKVTGSSTDCAAGYQHSVVELALLEAPAADLDRVSRTACSSVADGPNGARSERTNWCSHGLGHGLARRMGTKDISRALAACEQTVLPFACQSGAYMEVQFRDASLSKDPYDRLCRTLPDRFKTSCYWKYAVDAMWVTPAWEQQVADCLAIEDRWIGICMYGIGQTAWRKSEGRRMQAQCDSTGAYRIDCLLGAIRYVLDDPPQLPAEARRICNAAGDKRSACLRHAGQVVRRVAPQESSTLCAAIEGRGSSECLRGAAEQLPLEDDAALARAAGRLTGSFS